MKKRMMQLLAMCLCVCMAAAPALAVDMTIASEQAQAEQDYRVMTDVAVVGDTAYFRVYTQWGEQIWHWREGMQRIEKAAEGLLRASDYSTIEAAEEAVGAEAAKYGIVALFSDGERLMGLNHLNGLIYEIDIADGKPIFTDVTTVEEPFIFYQDYFEDRWYWSPNAIAVSGGYLYWYSSGSTSEKGVNRQRITRISLTDGSCHDLDAARVDAICAYKDGMLLILCRADRRTDKNGKPVSTPAFPGDLYVYDPDTDTMTAAGTIDAQSRVTSMAYSPELDAVLYQDGTSIMGVKNMGGAQRYAYTNTAARGRLSAIGDVLIHSTVSAAIVRDLVEGFSAPDSLQILNASHDKAANAFGEKYTTVPLEFQLVETLGFDQYFMPAEGGERADVACLYTNTDGWEFESLIEKDVLMDLSVDPEIRAYVDALYPPFREMVSGSNGEIWGIPTEANSYTGVFVNRKALADLGLTTEEIPVTLTGLYAFVSRWDREFADKYPNYACIEYSEDTRRYLLDLTVDMWIAHCQAEGQELHFDDPIFRELMTELEKVETVRADLSMQTSDPEVSDYKTGLFWMGCQLVGNWASYMEEYSDRIFIPLTLTEDVPFHAGVDRIELWVVNRHSESPEYALKFLNEQIAAVNDKYAHVLLTTRTEPVESPYYAESLAYEMDILSKRKAELAAETDEAVKQRLHERIERQQEYIDTELKRSMYTVTPSAIENYLKVIAPAMYVHRSSVLDDTTEGIQMIESLMDRWLEGSLTTEQFILEADLRLLMLETIQD